MTLFLVILFFVQFLLFGDALDTNLASLNRNVNKIFCRVSTFWPFKGVITPTKVRETHSSPWNSISSGCFQSLSGRPSMTTRQPSGVHCSSIRPGYLENTALRTTTPTQAKAAIAIWFRVNPSFIGLVLRLLFREQSTSDLRPWDWAFPFLGRNSPYPKLINIIFFWSRCNDLNHIAMPLKNG